MDQRSVPGIHWIFFAVDVNVGALPIQLCRQRVFTFVGAQFLALSFWFMHTPSGSVAVLFFSLSARQEAQRKPLADSTGRSEAVWNLINQLTSSKIQALGLPFFVSHKLIPTCSGTFGEQLYQATQAVLDLGYEAVICVGNDCPALRLSDLREAVRVLQTGAIPVGVDKRGGVYLTGFNKASLTDERAFTSLPWQTTSLAQKLVGYLHQQAQETVIVSAIHADWNARTDIRVTQLVGQRTWLRRLTEALYPTEAGYMPVRQYPLSAQASVPSRLRAPPARM